MNMKIIRVTIRLSETESGVLISKAKASQYSKSEFIRKALLNVTIKSKFTKEEVNLLRNLIGISTNINQLTKRVNSREDLLFLSIELQRTLRNINNILDSFKSR